MDKDKCLQIRICIYQVKVSVRKLYEKILKRIVVNLHMIHCIISVEMKK